MMQRVEAGMERLELRPANRAGASPARELTQASVRAIAIRAAGAAFGLAFNILLSRSLGPAGTGVALFCLNVATMAGLVATGGMDIVGMRELSRHAGDAAEATAILGRTFANAMLSVVVFSFGAFLFLWLAGGRFTGGASVLIDAACALMLALAAAQKILSDLLVAVREYASSQLTYYFINRVASVGAVLLLLAAGAAASPALFVCVYALGLALAVAFALSRVLAHFPWREIARKLTFAMSTLREGIACAIQNTAFILLGLSPFVLLGAFSTAAQLGEFGVSQRLVAVIILALTTISQLSMRDFSRAFASQDSGHFAHALTTSLRLTCIAATGLTVPLVLFAPVWVTVFGAGFAAAAPVLAILSLGICSQCFGMPFQAALFATNHETLARDVTIACAAIGIGLNAWLVPSWGAFGAAIGTSVGLALQSLGHGVCVFRALPVRLQVAAIRVVAT